jgi:phospholipase/carboxylesterase
MVTRSERDVGFDLPKRRGPKPETTRPTREERKPHKQLTQNAPGDLQEELLERVRQLTNVSIGDSLVSVPGARAFHLFEESARGPREAFQAGREFAHLHPAEDGSLHMTLPPGLYAEVLATGWGEPHPLSGTMLVWGPRDTDELEVVWRLVKSSYAYATGA